MDLPNPYAGNYRRLLIAPALFVVISLIVLLFISPIREGIDFRGGIDITVLSSQPVDSAVLSQAFAKSGYVLDSIISKSNPTGGYDTQIELERSDALVQADALKDRYFTLSDKTAGDEANATILNSSSSAARYAQDRVVLDAIANDMFNRSGSANLSASSYNTTSSLDNAFITAYSNLTSSENNRLQNLVAAQIPNSTASFNEVTSSLSSTFLSQTINVVLYSILFTAITVFIIFRTPVTVISVISGAAADIVIALGAMGLFGIPLTLASFAGLLMLVGFSLDTAILLAMRVLKHKDGTPASRALDAMKTGLTMTLSALVAFSALFVLAYVTHIPTYYQISTVVLAGLIGDIFAAWAFTAVVHLHYKEEEDQKGGSAPLKPLASYIFKS